ncbi:UDP-glucosyltransferase 2-like isoform X2 [Pectinophora gossypiella]|nr:UDP-glucosyltransferase 2-like isoform X2 [Pectinophora gossypiella]XP_049885631.1 UDP-glucosyltransferase 2-like isoform X2 [Pectinophora gossypiella]XP_049885632.1 UDP-glucosyltransferase 2-like isoform X2 [Pectinophora gossypiella]
MDNSMQQKDLHLLRRFSLDTALVTFDNVNVKKLFNDKSQKFDAVIADLYETEIYAGLAALYDCPMIWSYSMGAHYVALRIIEGPTNPSYVPDYLSSNVPPLTFTQRLEELWDYIKWTYVKKFYTEPEEEEMYRNIFVPLLTARGKKSPRYDKLVYNASLILANDIIAAGNVPKVPLNFKFVGGQHIETPTRPLPEHLQTLMDKSTNGVIYFSLGSTWQSKDIPKQLVDDLLRVFRSLKQTVIWKFEADLKHTPPNVHITSWAPQPSILAHPNCLIFISHGGLLSFMEAVHYGVPIIGLPIYLDQFVNVNKAVAQGYALKVDLNMKLPQNLKKALHVMLKDNSYANRAKELSAIHHDALHPPSAEVVHWVEHVVRTRGAPHLRSPAHCMPWYQRIYLDFIILIITTLVVVKIIITRLLATTKRGKKNTTKKRN